MVPIGLWDTLYFEEESSGQIRLECRQRVDRSAVDLTDKASLQVAPDGEDNLVVRAVRLLRDRAGVRRGASLRLVKRIPVAAGLGGGSSDAAAALVAANAGWRLGYSQAELAPLAGELGSDVPFFLGKGPAVCRGRGERMEPVTGCRALHFVVVHPPAGLSTAAVYDACRPAERPRSIQPVLEAIARGDVAELGRRLFNRLAPAAGRLCEWTERLRQTFAAEDLLGHEMSGSGTCHFGLCRHRSHARRVARRLQATGVGTAFAVRGSL